MGNDETYKGINCNTWRDHPQVSKQRNNPTVELR